MTYDEHLEWCKSRARVFLDRYEPAEAVACMIIDMDQHDECRKVMLNIAAVGILYAVNGDLDGARRFVEGFR